VNPLIPTVLPEMMNDAALSALVTLERNLSHLIRPGSINLISMFNSASYRISHPVIHARK
jgi:hypothetical protein